ncbi:hypothetical protein [Agarivorans sp. B2Z047]|nr:hypothetical protein [Agarivorans sp. B2Z047]UQN44850.1 hypothetical protein LQZ07_10415 [Agarivorans sp. B2Z047]
MRPIRKEIINGTVVSEFYYAGQIVVYIDHERTSMSFSEAKAYLIEKGE